MGDMRDPLESGTDNQPRAPSNVRRPEKETLTPSSLYKGAHQATLDPLAARRPDGGLFMWREQFETAESVCLRQPAAENTVGRGALSYDVPHAIPWDWRVSLYTWTKGLAAGAY